MSNRAATTAAKCSSAPCKIDALAPAEVVDTIETFVSTGGVDVKASDEDCFIDGRPDRKIQMDPYEFA